jgi:hypothetical protein
LIEEDISFNSVNSELKASVVERFNRTIKEKIYRYFTLKNSFTYTNVLQELVYSYNNNFHRSIKMQPSKVSRAKEEKVFNTLYKYEDIEGKKNFSFEIGDTVRISKFKRIFDKGYTPNWTEEVFIITTRIPRVPPVYKLKDLNNEEIEGVFYETELQKIIQTSQSFLIEKVLKKRIVNGLEEYFVSWKGYPSTFNSWITEKDFEKI